MKHHIGLGQHFDIATLLRYFIIFVSFLALCITLLNIYAYFSRKQLQENATRFIQASLNSGMERLEVMLNEYVSASYVIEDETGISQGLYKGNDTSGIGLYNIGKSRDFIKSVLFYTTSQDSALMTGIIIRDGLVINYLSSNQANSVRVYLTPDNMFGKYFICEGCESYHDWLSILQNSQNLSLLPERNYVINTGSRTNPDSDPESNGYRTFHAVTFIVRLPINSGRQPFILYALLDSKKLAEVLLPIANLERYQVSLVDRHGAVILSVGNPIADQPVIISTTSDFFGLTTNLTIDSAIISESLSQFNRTVLQFGLLFLIIGIFMAAIFTWGSYKPLGNILAAAYKLDPASSHDDACHRKSLYQYILAVLNNSGISIRAYEAELDRQSSELNYLTFYHLLVNNDQSTGYVLPLGVQFCFLVYIRLKTEDEDEETRDSLLKLSVPIVRKALPAGACAYHIRRAIVALIPDQNISQEYEKLVHDIANELSASGNLLCKMIISESCPVTSIYEVFQRLQNQAKYVSYKRYSFIYFSQEISPAQYSIYEQVEQISIIRVYSLIMQRQGSTLCNYLDEIMKSIASGDMNDESSVRYICSTFSAAVNRIIHENQLQPDQVYTIPEYHADYEIPELFDQIRRCITALCSVLDDARQTGQHQFESDVMQYIHNNIADPDLCITAITDHFGIPANELQSIIRHAQGKSFLQYIEGYRMQMAYSLICDSNITIREISSKCGYSSQNSFYKAYRRYFGKSPSSHRIKVDISNRGDGL